MVGKVNKKQIFYFQRMLLLFLCLFLISKEMKSVLTDTCVAVYEFERGLLLKNIVLHLRFTCAMTSPLKKQNNVATHRP